MPTKTTTCLPADTLANPPTALPEPTSIEVAIRARQVENNEATQLEGLSPNAKTRLQGFARKHGLDYVLVRHKFLTDDLFRYAFGTDASKQTVHETTVRSNLEDTPLFMAFRKPAPMGPQSLQLDDKGTVRLACELGDALDQARSIDFTWEFTVQTLERRPRVLSLRAYASHKHTTGQGGAQDNARAELERFLDAASGQSSPGDTVFFALADGTHYERHWARMAAHVRGPRAVLCTSQQVLPAWAAQVQAWLARNDLEPDLYAATCLTLLEG